jgi:hypothetical protein
MKNICIIFVGGQYGTFLEWCLNYFTDLNFPEKLPFNSNGNSHKFLGNHLYNINGCRKYVDSDITHQFVRFHLMTPETYDDPFEYFGYAYKNFNKVIFLYALSDSFAWCWNNKFEKIFNRGFLDSNRDFYNGLLKNWGENKSLDNIDRWELREFLSYLINYPQYVSETSLELLDSYKLHYKNAIFIPISNFRDCFELTMKKLIKDLQLPVVRNNFSEIYNTWISLQHHCYKDALIKKIIDSTLNLSDEFEWKETTLVDEALIQYYLRQHGFEIQCHNLNAFPTSSKDLKKIIYEST